MENPEVEGKLFVFIGEKISVIDDGNLEYDYLMRDSRFKAKYKVLEDICGDYDKDTIEFIVYDHYGKPQFSDYENVVLFVHEYNDTFYHAKYLFYDVYKTKRGDWASPYRLFSNLDFDTTIIKPRRVDFASRIAFPLKKYSRQTRKKYFQEPFFSIDGDSAIAKYGYNASELFQLKKEGVLKAGGVFGDPNRQIEPKEVVLEEIDPPVQVPKHDSANLIKAWKDLMSAIKQRDILKIKELTSDTVLCSFCTDMGYEYYESSKEPIDTFIAHSYFDVTGRIFWNKVVSNNRFKADPYIQGVGALPTYTIITITYSIMDSFSTNYTHSINFIKKGNQFKFTGIRSD